MLHLSSLYYPACSLLIINGLFHTLITHPIETEASNEEQSHLACAHFDNLYIFFLLTFLDI